MSAFSSKNQEASLFLSLNNDITRLATVLDSTPEIRKLLYYIDKNDNLVLVDYKTDYVEKGKEELLVEKYKEQLNLYKEALEKSLNRRVSKVGIYSLYLNKLIQIEST